MKESSDPMGNTIMSFKKESTDADADGYVGISGRIRSVASGGGGRGVYSHHKYAPYLICFNTVHHQ